MKHFFLFLCITLLTASVGAADSQLLLEVNATRISRAELSRSLQAELAASNAAEVAGTLALSDEPSDVVRIVYRDTKGNRTVRDLQIAADDPDALDKVTLAAANMLRNQDDLVATLAALPAAGKAAPKPAPNAPTSARDRTQKLAQPSPADPCAVTPMIAVGGDLAPFLGTSSTPEGRNSGRHVSVSLLGSLSKGTRGVTVSSGVNVDRGGVCGLALGIGNANLGPLRGVQLAVVNLAHGGVVGLQAAVANAATGGLRGAQFGVANGVFGDVTGVQGGVSNIVLGGVHGAQIGVFNLAVGHVGGAQLGVVNVATGDATVQLGTANFARGAVNTQVGVFNVSDRAKAPIGILSIVRHGRTTLDAWATENGTLLAGVSHGGSIVHNIYGVGARVGSAGTRASAALGIGARLWTRERYTLDFDVIGDQTFRGAKFRHTAATVRARLALSVFVLERVAVFAGAGYAILFADDLSERTQAPFGQHKLWQTDGSHPTRAYTFPSLTLGLRVALGPRS